MADPQNFRCWANRCDIPVVKNVAGKTHPALDLFGLPKNKEVKAGARLVNLSGGGPWGHQ
jgi:hypothetical protein